VPRSFLEPWALRTARIRTHKRIGPFERKPLPKPIAANDSWSTDFMSDGLADGRRLRCLTIVDDCTREYVAIEVDTSISGSRVKTVLERLADLRGLPRSITVDHGPEFEGQVMDAWAYQRGVGLSFIRPGKPNDNAYIESFNGKFRDECLNELVPQHRACTGSDRELARRVQRRAHSQLAGRHHTRGVRSEDCSGAEAKRKFNRRL
jgi:transposase InsO family protein